MHYFQLKIFLQRHRFPIQEKEINFNKIINEEFILIKFIAQMIYFFVISLKKSL